MLLPLRLDLNSPNYNSRKIKQYNYPEAERIHLLKQLGYNPKSDWELYRNQFLMKNEKYISALQYNKECKTVKKEQIRSSFDFKI
jgi:hypothetical protein